MLSLAQCSNPLHFEYIQSNRHMNMKQQPNTLADGSNPEGVYPVLALNWNAKTDLCDVVVNGPAFSHATTKLHTF